LKILVQTLRRKLVTDRLRDPGVRFRTPNQLSLWARIETTSSGFR
jgi:hypothetical protein